MPDDEHEIDGEVKPLDPDLLGEPEDVDEDGGDDLDTDEGHVRKAKKKPGEDDEDVEDDEDESLESLRDAELDKEDSYDDIDLI